MNRKQNIFRARFARFACSSLASTAVDQLVAWMLFAALRNYFAGADFLRILLATGIARCVSMACNFAINQCIVFKSTSDAPKRRKRESFPRFALLSFCVLSLSSLGVWMAHTGLGVAEWQAKPVVDFVLFFLNYTGQRKWVFVDTRVSEQPAIA